METKTQYKTIAFAYFANDEFLGWYGGTFGSVASTPKLYGNSEHQLETIEKNFKYKLKRVNESSFKEEKNKTKNVFQAISLFGFDGEELLRGKDVELRLVESPEYSGPNPDFDEVAWEKYRKARRKVFKKESSHLSNGFSKERNEFVKEFNKRHPELNKRPNNWVYPDYEKVNEWALKTPTKFLGKFEYKLK